MRRALLLMLCLASLLRLTGHSQGKFSHYLHYTVNDGLPSSKVFDILQDSRGYIWFATENGVSRFNGYSFMNYTTSEGLPANSTVRLFEDRFGRVWFSSYQGPMSYFQDDTIHPFPANDLLDTLNTAFIAGLYIDEAKNYWMTPFEGGLIRFDSSFILAHFGLQKIATDSIFFYRKKNRHGIINCFFNKIPWNLDLNADTYELNDSSWLYKLARGQTDNHLNSLEVNGRTYISFGKSLYRVNGTEIQRIKTYGNEIIELLKDKRGNAWVSEKFNGAYMHEGYPEGEPVMHFLEGTTVSGILQDSEDNYWFTTTESGVYFVPSLDLAIISKANSDIQSDVIIGLEIDGDDVFFSTEQKGFYHAVIKGKSLSDIRSLAHEKGFINNVNAILKIPGDTLYISADIYPDLPDSITPYRKGGFQIFPLEYGYSITRTFDGQILFGHYNGIQLVDGYRILYDTPMDIQDFRVFDALQAPDSSYWLGVISGLFRFKDSVYTRAFPADPVLASRISRLHYFRGNLWVGTFDRGLAVLAGDTTYYINTSNGLSSNRVKSICAESDSVIWIGTNRGVNRISLKGTDPLVFRIGTLDIWDGLPSNEINVVRKHGNELLLATDGGLAAFDPSDISFERDPMPLVLEHVTVDPDMMLPMDEIPRLKYNQNSIIFEYYGITFKNPVETSYNYKLEGLNDEWNRTRNTSVRFHNLAPGDYKFLIRAVSAEGVESATLEYPFVIRKRITQTFGFLLAVSLTATLLVFLFVRNIIETQRKRSQLQRQIFMAEQKAMLAQMNPHFIFNSLNSIQNFILENDSVNANVYLVIFSSLIRKILEASQRNFISLKEEVEIIKLYLELEKFRFQNRFDFSIRIHDNVNPDQVSIPSMIIQPYLENAIWHGIMPKKEMGHVELEVMRTGQRTIQILVTDNGIGRAKALEISRRRKQHKPTGMKNVEERLNLLNELNRTRMTVRVTDLHDDKGDPSGTRVEINLEE